MRKRCVACASIAWNGEYYEAPLWGLTYFWRPYFRVSG
nr:hypothetical protein HUO10_006802 [Paraburkholderia busanensis]